MAHFIGNRAWNTGRYRSYIAAACLRAIRTFACCAGGLIWNTAERLSSHASRSVMYDRYRSPFFRPITAIIASTWTRHSTNSALAGGRSSASGSGTWDTDKLHLAITEPPMNTVGQLQDVVTGQLLACRAITGVG